MWTTLLWVQLASSSLQRRVRGAPRPRVWEVVSIRSDPLRACAAIAVGDLPFGGVVCPVFIWPVLPRCCG